MNVKASRILHRVRAIWKDWAAVIGWSFGPILAALAYLILAPSHGSASAPTDNGVAVVSTCLQPTTPRRFTEIPGIADLRGWSDGITIVYARNGEVVWACYAGTANRPALIPPAGTQLYGFDGKYSGWCIPDTVKTAELQSSLFADLPDGPSSTEIDHTAPGVAENGSYYGEISTVNGLPRTNLVSGYYRRDGTYVRGYYRSR
jgi:hypothetical protein